MNRSAPPASSARCVRPHPTARAAVLAFSALATAASLEREARAYCFTTTCNGVDACDDVALPGCTPTSWASRCVGFTVNDRTLGGLDPDSVEEIAKRAFGRWQASDCGDGLPPGLHVEFMGVVSCATTEYNFDAGNANIIMMTDQPGGGISGHTFALTTTSFDPNTGELLNADIELNVRDHAFTVGDGVVDVDLEAVLVHEVGHFLGIAHSQVVDATMFPFYEPGTTEIRSLTKDDEAAICVLYPPSPDVTPTCNPLPKHGFSPECRVDQAEGDCRVAGPGLAGWISVSLLLGASTLSRRRGHRPRRTRP
jgi:hypothetical protein